MGNPHILTEHARLFIGLGGRKRSILLELLFGDRSCAVPCLAEAGAGFEQGNHENT